MASRRVQQTKARQMVEDLVSEDEDDDLDFFASQQSSGSDDNEIEMALAERYAAKKKEKQQKFLKAVYKQLNHDVFPFNFLVHYLTSESLFADFLLQYAACEDKIRHLLGQILTEQQKLLTFADQHNAANVEEGKKVEAGHISGLSRAKAACNDFQDVINKIVPQTL
ncbi:hypothetical protein L208DRAFT_1459836 [Tricholoma matsutake]|nr:hypothetical protein L208DRAFT_1459836 [Tricholoma matsutake 945]